MPVPLSLRSAMVTALVAVMVSPVVPATTWRADAHDAGGRWECLAHYESSHRWHVNTGNGHYGGLQFSLSTWRYYGGPRYSGNRYPHRATRAEQIMIGKRTAFRGWRDRAPQGGANAWPNTWGYCS